MSKIIIQSPEYSSEALSYSFRGHQCAYHQIESTGVDRREVDTLIMIHNGMMDFRLFDFQIEYFSQFYRVIAMDLLGYGLSDRPNITFNTQLYVDQLEALLSHLELDTCLLLGCCIGGAVSTQFTQQNPHRVIRLAIVTLDAPEVVEAGVLGQLSKGTPFGSLRHKIGCRVMRSYFGRKIFKHFMLTHQLGEYAGQEPDWDKRFNHYYQDKLAIRTFTQFDVEDCDLRAAIRANKFPDTFVCWGANNTLLPAEQGLAWAEHFKANIIQKVDDAGYMILRQQPELINKSIHDFYQ